MKRVRFLRELENYCNANNLSYDWKKGKGKGKGSHGTVYVGQDKTTVKDGEIDPLVKEYILKQLRIPKDAF